MKKIIALAALLLIFGITAPQTYSQERLSVGAGYVHRSIKSYEDYGYPRLSFEYRATRSSSFELLAEYIDLNRQPYSGFVSYPLSFGYKLNFVPLLTKKERITSTFEGYNSLRYVLTFTNQGSTAHSLRYAAGINVFVSDHWGLNGEMVFGQNMKTTFALGIKYRFGNEK